MTPSIIETMCDPALFGRFFRKPETWQNWRCFLKILFGLDWNETERRIFAQHTGRATPQRGGYREGWLICGRRSGKSFCLALIAVYLATFREWRQYLGPVRSAL